MFTVTFSISDQVLDATLGEYGLSVDDQRRFALCEALAQVLDEGDMDLTLKGALESAASIVSDEERNLAEG